MLAVSAVGQVGASGMTMRQLFDEIDTDCGGTIDKEEMRDGLSRVGVKMTAPEFEVSASWWNAGGSLCGIGARFCQYPSCLCRYQPCRRASAGCQWLGEFSASVTPQVAATNSFTPL
jgi:hypothetical protein